MICSMNRCTRKAAYVDGFVDDERGMAVLHLHKGLPFYRCSQHRAHWSNDSPTLPIWEQKLVEGSCLLITVKGPLVTNMETKEVE